MEHHRAGRLAQAQALYRQILTAQPDQPDALHLLGLVVAGMGKYDEAIGLIERAVAQHPNVADYVYNLAQVCEQAGRDDRAVAAYEQACRIKPDFVEAWNNLGAVLMRAGRWSESVKAFERAVALRPNLLGAQTCIGIGHQRHLNFPAAIQAFRKAISIKPDDPSANYNLGTALLTTGEFPAGWEGYEWRWRIGSPSRPRLTQPQWTGENPAGKRILLWPEQGFGDAIQFVRYAPILAARGASVILSAPPELFRLMKSVQGVAHLTPDREPNLPYDLHAPLLSLPRLFKTTLASVPANVPYLRPDPADVAKWKSRIPTDPGVRKIGIAWAGRPTHADDRNRSIPLESLLPLLQTPGTWFTSLQKSPVGPLNQLPPAMTDWTSELKDFADTAALIESLDLVITVDTAIAHLAGAMGKPAWILLPSVPDWRWMLDRTDSPWYPTIKLFRQPAVGNWHSAIEAITQSLRESQ